MKFLQKIITKIPVESIKPGINKKEFFSSVLFLFVIYFLSIISIIRANFTYIDDLRRCIDGYELGGAFSRHLSNILGYFIHAGGYIVDISPLPQLIACFFLALSGFFLVKIICNKTNYWLLIASLPIGLSPFFLECISYKFDAPYMALSILASVFPFVFINKNKWIFAIVSIVSLLIMTMTYQAASGIFLMMAVYLFFVNFNYKNISIKNNLISLCISLLSYCIAIILYRYCFMEPVDFGYVSSETPKIGSLVPVFLTNLKIYATNVYKDFNITWKILLLTIFVIYYIKTIFLSKINKILSFFLTSIFLVLLFVLSFGLYLILKDPFYGPRTMYGFGVFIAILCVDIVFSLKKVFAIPVIALIWCFFVFYFSYGNALADQKRYNDFRTELLLKDLSSLLPKKTDAKYSIKIVHSEGFSPTVEYLAKKFPITKKIVPVNLKGGWPFGFVYIIHYFKFNLTDGDISDETIETMPVVLDTYYHTIKYEDKQIAVILK